MDQAAAHAHGDAPAGDGWLHEIQYDGYRMHARINGGEVKLLTRTGLDCLTDTADDRGAWLHESDVGLSRR